MSAFTKNRVGRALRARNNARRGVTAAAVARPARAIEALEGRVLFNAVYHDLSATNFGQNWAATDALLTADNWNGIPSIIGYLGDGMTPTSTNPPTDPQVMTGDSLNIDLINGSSATSTTGGVHEINNDVVALQGSGTAVAPYLTLHLNSSGRQDVTVSYTLRELESATIDQRFALQYRTAATGAWTNVPAGAVNAALLNGFTAAGMQNTNVSVTLPAGANNQANLQVRVITHDAAGSDTMVGVDDIVVTSVPSASQAVGFDVTAVSVNEGAGTAQLSVKRTNGTTGAVTVDFATADGTAVASTDYTAASGTLTFVDGDAEELITVTILNDAAWEQAKSFTVTLSNATGADLGTSVATVTINNDDAPVGAPIASGPLTQNWSNTGLITADDDWTSVPYFLGFRGDDITTGTGVDPQTLLASGTNTPLDVNANKGPAWLQGVGENSASGGVSEMDGIANPTIAVTGSSTGDAPFVLWNVDTTGVSSIDVSYVVRDLETLDNAVQPVALHYRVGDTGTWTNVPEAFIADATDATDKKARLVWVTLDASDGIDNKSLVQFRVMTANAVGSDEMVGIDDVLVQQSAPGAGHFSFEEATATVNESAGTTSVKVVRVGGSSGAVNLGYSTTAGTAGSPGDFTSTSGTLAFADGQTEAFINVLITNDTTPEFSEAFTVTLGAASAGTVGSITTSTVTITNDDHHILADGPLTENWSDGTKTDVADDWSDFIDIQGYTGQGLAPAAGADPATITGFAGPLDLNPNSTLDPDGISPAPPPGVTRFNLEDPTIALAGPASATGATTAPFLLFEVSTVGVPAVDVSYTLRDLESVDNAVMPVALQYRVGNTGNFINVPAAYVADATTAGFGPDIAVSATVTGIGGNPLVQFRIITADAAGFDEWVGVDNITFAEGVGPSLPAWVDPASVATWDAGTSTLTVSGATTIIADPGVDQPLIVASGSGAVLTINPSSGSQVNVGGLSLANGATATVTDAGTGRVLVVAATGGLSVTTGGKLDLTDNDMVVKGTTLAAVQGLITGGYNNGTWDGGGVNSSAAANDANADTALGYLDNSEVQLTSFSGVTLTGNEVLVKYTYYGDADLTGVVDTDDFQLFLAGYQDSTLPRTWFYGDFDYTSVIDTDDFQVFLYGYQNQGGAL